MLALTKKTGYALVAMSHLAALGDGELASSRGIAERYDAPLSLLMNVLKDLAAAGYVESVRGSHGGYRLARRPADVSLGEVVEAIEGPLRLAECITDQAGPARQCTCQVMAHCPIVDPIHRMQRRLSDFLRTVSLAEIVGPSALSAGATSAAGRDGGVRS